MTRCVTGVIWSLVFATSGAWAGQLPAPKAGERFEVTSIKAVRPTLVNTLSALQKNDIAGARAAFTTYDLGWNGIEVYINTRSKEMYNELELNLQARVTKALEAPGADATAIAADVQAMIGKYDETIAMIEAAPPLNPLFDEVAKLRIVRSPLRLVTPALRTKDFARARTMFNQFDDHWDSIEDLVKERSADAYTAIEKAMIQIEQALTPATPDADATTALVATLTQQYNAIVTQVTAEARR